jgi:hypothetical protein
MVVWLVPAAITLHNLEEAIWLPAWSRSAAEGLRGADRWRRPVGTWSFRFAVAVLTAVAWGVAWLAHRDGPDGLGFYLLASYALGQGLNVVMPHLVVTLATGAYAPGLATGLLFVLPASVAFLMDAFTAPNFDVLRFIIVAVIFIPLMLLAIPLSFAVGRQLQLVVSSIKGAYKGACR